MGVSPLEISHCISNRNFTSTTDPIEFHYTSSPLNQKLKKFKGGKYQIFIEYDNNNYIIMGGKTYWLYCAIIINRAHNTWRPNRCGYEMVLYHCSERKTNPNSCNGIFGIDASKNKCECGPQQKLAISFNINTKNLSILETSEKNQHIEPYLLKHENNYNVADIITNNISDFSSHYKYMGGQMLDTPKCDIGWVVMDKILYLDQTDRNLKYNLMSYENIPSSTMVNRYASDGSSTKPIVDNESLLIAAISQFSKSVKLFNTQIVGDVSGKHIDEPGNLETIGYLLLLLILLIFTIVSYFTDFDIKIILIYIGIFISCIMIFMDDCKDTCADLKETECKSQKNCKWPKAQKQCIKTTTDEICGNHILNWVGLGIGLLVLFIYWVSMNKEPYFAKHCAIMIVSLLGSSGKLFTRHIKTYNDHYTRYSIIVIIIISIILSIVMHSENETITKGLGKIKEVFSRVSEMRSKSISSTSDTGTIGKSKLNYTPFDDSIKKLDMSKLHNARGLNYMLKEPINPNVTMLSNSVKM